MSISPHLKKLEEFSTYKLRMLATSAHTKKQDRVPLAVELLQRKFGNAGKSLRNCSHNSQSEE